MNMFRNFKQEQLQQLFKADNEHKYDVQRVHEKLSIHSLRTTLRALSLDQIDGFLEYQIENNLYKCLFYESFFDSIIKNLESEKLDSIILWISDREKISPIYFAQFQAYFSLDYTDETTWKERFEEFIEVLPTEDKIQNLKYGREYISQSLKFHEITCSKSTCEYQIRATKRLNKINHELTKIVPQKNHTINKMQWKGTQKQLAELFIELKKKEWIESYDYETIKACFTNSKTINQVLKPATDTTAGQNNYDQVYTRQYEPKFYGIALNPKPN